MCGIVGFLGGHASWSSDAEQVLVRMSTTLAHRGPDGSGHWIPSAGPRVGLGHRRLAILDLSDAGRQPMASGSGRYVVTFNGEVYNFAELRTELEGLGHRFRGHSDTEVMLAAFEQWGVERACTRLNGMFAFAVWDSSEQLLTLARDRLGKKPLYFLNHEGLLLFASELKAFKVVPGVRLEVDRNALALYLRHNYVPAPLTIYAGAEKLEPGTTATFRVRDGAVQRCGGSRYWDGGRTLLESRGSRRDMREADALDALESLLLDAVRLRMVADVPLGAFLSGGIDSSLVVALMQRASSRPVRTFTIGFEQTGYDEAVHAAAVARHLGTDHTEVYLTGADALAVVPRLPMIFDEPFADSSQIPTLLVSQVARQHVTVALSGDGGDESFLGYSRYTWARNLLESLQWAPAPLRRGFGRTLQAIPSGAWDALAGSIRPFLPARFRYSAPGDRVHKLAGLLTASGNRDLYRAFITHWPDPPALVKRGREPFSVLERMVPTRNNDEFVEEMARLDLLTYLPDDILVKVDRASMAVSLEVRAPLLDYRVVEFGGRMPFGLRMRDGNGKWLLRALLHRFVPRELVERPKMGFGVPLDAWLRGPLRHWAEELLDEARLRREGYFEPEPIRRAWREHLSGRAQRQYLLWDVLMFQSWLEAR